MPPPSIKDIRFIPTALLEQYKLQIASDVQQNFENLRDSDLSIDTFSFYTSVSAVFSSKIEGEEMELDSYIKHKRLGGHFSADYTRKTDDLYAAYVYAQQNKLGSENLFESHKLITKNILQPSRQGEIRAGNMFVLTDDGRIEYVAAEPRIVKRELDCLLTDIDTLLVSELHFNEVLFFSSMIHLLFVKIHPFEDGNGRTARLLEKWFIAQKLGAKAWFIQSEKNYYNQHQNYYKNLRALGLEYDSLDYNKALPFLLMLPQSIITQP